MPAGKKGKDKPVTPVEGEKGTKGTKGAKEVKKTLKKDKKSALFVARPKEFGIGRAPPPKGKIDIRHFYKWPKYVLLQRRKRVLLRRLKIPPTLNQFNYTLDKNGATQLFKLLNKYRPETKQAKKQRLLESAKAKEKGEDKTKTNKPNLVKYGLHHITALIENKQAKLVAIAHDVDPVELVLWLPALCRKMGVPYCVVKGKSRLGTVVRKKTATAVALTSVNKEDQHDLAELAKTCKERFNNNVEIRRKWGGGLLGRKSLHKIIQRKRAVAKEEKAKMKL